MQRIMFAWTEWHYGNDTNASRLKKTIAKKNTLPWKSWCNYLKQKNDGQTFQVRIEKDWCPLLVYVIQKGEAKFYKPPTGNICWKKGLKMMGGHNSSEWMAKWPKGDKAQLSNL